MNATRLEAVPAETRPPAATPRLALLELARWIAIYAIVWLHTVQSDLLRPSTVLTRFAVPFFVAACVYLIFQGVHRNPQRTFVRYGWSRFLRIYVPFLGWCVIYLAFKVLKGVFFPNQPNEYPHGWEVLRILWTGTFYHLWFMPFILLVSLAAFLVAKIVNQLAWLRWPVAIGSLIAGLALTVPAVAEAGGWEDFPSQYVVFAMPAMFWAITLGLAFRPSIESRTHSTPHAPREDGGEQPHAEREEYIRISDAQCLATPNCPGSALCSCRFPVDILFFAGNMVLLGILGRSSLCENLAGISLLLIALRPADSPWLRRVGQFPSLAYGIYLSHLLPIKMFDSLATWQGLSPSWQLDAAVFLASAAAATLIAFVLNQFRWTRWLVA